MPIFLHQSSTLDNYFRAVILFGKNTASYKFALGQSLFELANQGKNLAHLEELAIPFSKHIIEHIKSANKQGSSRSSKFLETCNDYIQGEISEQFLIDQTVRLGFTNVIDAFHIVNQKEIPVRFFLDERKTNNAIRITDNFFALKESFQATNLPFETEARWKLVETAWSLNISSSLLVVNFDPLGEQLFIEEREIRRNVTSSRDALNGYQKGKCFYCFSDIAIDCSDENLGDVDHFFPNTLKRVLPQEKVNLDGVWNLVLCCPRCNRGEKGKFAQIPEMKYLERLNTRNNFLIESHHPLRETLIAQTGASDQVRIDFLKSIDALAIQYLIHRWRPEYEQPEAF